jgi:hypothetical protein
LERKIEDKILRGGASNFRIESTDKRTRGLLPQLGGSKTVQNSTANLREGVTQQDIKASLHKNTAGSVAGLSGAHPMSMRERWMKEKNASP